MDELLLQVAESLRKTLALSVRRGVDRVRRPPAAHGFVPDAPVATLTLTPDEESVVARAGVTGRPGSACGHASVVAGRETCVVRVAPTTHSGSVLGLIVAVRPDRRRPVHGRR